MQTNMHWRSLMDELPTGTVTFLFTDMEGSTSLAQEYPTAMPALLARHHAILHEAIETHHGHVFQIIGDAFCAAFYTAGDALKAALEAQRSLQHEAWQPSPVKVRMGLHTGAAQAGASEERAGGYVGYSTLARTQRVMSMAHGGQVLLSNSTAELLRGQLPVEVALRDMKEHRLKGLLNPERLWQIIAPDLQQDFPPLQSLTKSNPFDEFLALARRDRPEADLGFLGSSLYSETLTSQEQRQFIQLIEFARSLQIENPLYETIYQHLLHLYVLNGSRLDLLKTIDRRLRGVAEGQGAMLLVSGISGIGKTSLVMAFQERMQQLGVEFIPIMCSEQERTSYALWQDVARAAAATGASLEALLAPIGAGKEAQSSQQLKQALADWLNQSAATQPLVILLDDLHWADADSLEVLNHLSSQSVHAPILFIATYRSEETQSRSPLDDFLPKLRRNRQIDLIHLNPLSRDDVERLITAYHGSGGPELAMYLHERAEGHPLFTAELLNDLIAQDLLTQDQAGNWLPPEQSIPVPAFLKQLITQRVSRLGDRVEQLLSVAAVAGEVWHLEIIEQLLDLPESELLAALTSALRAEMITVEDDQAEIYHFAHGLIREVLYSSQLARRRKRLHEQIAIQFEQQQAANVYAIAQHFFEAESWEKAVNYCLAAGEEANRRFANHSALQWYQRALTATQRAEKVLDQAIQFAIYDRLGRTYLALEQREEAELVYSRLRDAAQSNGDLVAEGQALVNLANVRMRLYQLDLAEKTAYEALKLGEQTGDLRLLTSVHAYLGTLLITRGQLDQAAGHHAEVLQNAAVLGESGALLDAIRFSSYQAIWAGQYQDAQTHAYRALQLAQKNADSLAIAGAYQNLSFAQIESGQYHAAYQNLRTTLEDIEQSGAHHHQKPRLLNLMGYLYLELGDAQAALSWDQKALESIDDTQVQSLEMRRYSLLNQATDYLQLGKIDEALEIVAQFETIKTGAEFAHFRYFNRYQLLLCEIHLARQAFDQAIESAQEARSLAQSKGMPKNIAKSHWFEGQAMAKVRRFDEALKQLEKAIGIVDGIQHGSLRWKIRLNLAATLKKAGESPEEVVRQARELIDQTSNSLAPSPLQNVLLSSRWIKQLEELEHNSAPEKLAYPAGLTAREVEVLRLVAGGATNQQIAQTLHVSVHTVNTHLTNILNKTGCENRTAASAFAIQHNLASA
jgi:predicted ATPase/class 3 adenylate cyclase/DNA-binding CsgD family transcriptional regulator